MADLLPAWKRPESCSESDKELTGQSFPEKPYQEDHGDKRCAGFQHREDLMLEATWERMRQFSSALNEKGTDTP